MLNISDFPFPGRIISYLYCFEWYSRSALKPNWKRCKRFHIFYILFTVLKYTLRYDQLIRILRLWRFIFLLPIRTYRMHNFIRAMFHIFIYHSYLKSSEYAQFPISVSAAISFWICTLHESVVLLVSQNFWSLRLGLCALEQILKEKMWKNFCWFSTRKRHLIGLFTYLQLTRNSWHYSCPRCTVIITQNHAFEKSNGTKWE